MVYFTTIDVIEYIEQQQAGKIIDPVCVDRNFLIDAYEVAMGLPPYSGVV
jgi:hypothetical protein